MCGLGGGLRNFPLLGFIKESKSNPDGEGTEDVQTNLEEE